MNILPENYEYCRYTYCKYIYFYCVTKHTLKQMNHINQCTSYLKVYVQDFSTETKNILSSAFKALTGKNNLVC